jgi:hypothetical protein
LRRQWRGRCWRGKCTAVFHSRIKAWHLNTTSHTQRNHTAQKLAANWVVLSRIAGSPQAIWPCACQYNNTDVNFIRITGVADSEVITRITEEMSLHRTDWNRGFEICTFSNAYFLLFIATFCLYELWI